MTDVERRWDAEAESVLAAVAAQPRIAAERAQALLDESRAAGEWAAASQSARALGLANAALADMVSAEGHLRTAVKLGRRSGVGAHEGGARMSLAGVLAQSGRETASLREIGRALDLLEGPARARAQAQRGAIRQAFGRIEDARADYAVALQTLPEDDVQWRQRVLMNSGMLNTVAHDYAAATADLEAAEQLCAEHGLDAVGALVHENLVGLRRTVGDVPGALLHLDEGERLARKVGASLGPLMWERAELLISLNLSDEAREAAEVAVTEYQRSGRPLYATDARLLLARAASAADPEYALEQARRARTEFRRQGRHAWAAYAEYAVLACARELPDPEPPSLTKLAAVAAELDAAGWDLAAADARLLARTVTARTRATVERRAALLEAVTPLREGPTAWHRVRGWQAAAVLRQFAGHPKAADRAARAGLDELQRHRASLAATDLRAHASELGAEMAALGLHNALRSGAGWRVLAWAERGRAQHLQGARIEPEADGSLGPRLAELRAVMGAIDRGRREGTDVAALERQRGSLERTIREQTWRNPAPTAEIPVEGVSRERLVDEVGAAALVHLVVDEGVVSAGVIAGGRMRLLRLGRYDDIVRSLDWLRFAIERIARSHDVPPGQAALLDARLGKLAADVVHPIVRAIGDRALVVVPTGGLALLPWSMFDGIRGRSVTVAPSVQLWWRARTDPAAQTTGTAVVCGPGLRNGPAEAAAVAAVHGVDPVVGAAATVDEVGDLMAETRLVHLVAHGSIRSDSPLFSTLRLADGPMTLYDLERLPRTPTVVTLSACQGTGTVMLPGDEPLGFASALLARGSRQVVGSTTAVPDRESGPLMTALHQGLADGLAAAEALARVQSDADPADLRSWTAATGFLCLGG